MHTIAANRIESNSLPNSSPNIFIREIKYIFNIIFHAKTYIKLHRCKEGGWDTL